VGFINMRRLEKRAILDVAAFTKSMASLMNLMS